MKFKPRAFLPLTLALGTASLAVAYDIDGKRWEGGQTVFYIGMPGVSPSGQSWSNAFENAMATWNAETSFRFLVTDGYVDPCTGYTTSFNGSGHPAGIGDNRNSTDFRSNLCGNAFGDGVLAVTLTFEQPGSLGFSNLVETDIIFNGGYDWDIYEGPSGDTIDFGRVALHELGHALGLGHEPFEAAIMAPFVSTISTLQADDIAGVDAIYATPNECLITQVSTTAAIQGQLGDGDCRIRDLFGGSRDFSFVDSYSLVLTDETFLDISLTSSDLDPVLIIRKKNSADRPQIIDDIAGSCDARLTTTLPAGEYELLVNTYDQPQKCAGNSGDYNLTISNTTMPVLGTIKNASGAPLLAEALINGGASTNGSEFFRGSFTARELIDVNARIAPDPEHIGQPANLYVLVTLSDGRQFSKNIEGNFVQYDGNLASLQPVRSGNLAALETIVIANDLQGIASGLQGMTISVHVGYAMASSPQNIFYGSNPIQFAIGL